MLKYVLPILLVIVLLACTSPPAATQTPQPTAALAPTLPTATSIPIPIAGPTSTLMPTAWEFRRSKDALTGTVINSIVTKGEIVSPTRHAALYESPTLIIRCKGDNSEAFIHWGGRFITGRERIPTQYSVDTGEVWKDLGGSSTNNQGSFFNSPKQLVARITGGQLVVVRVTNYDKDPMTARFEVFGIIRRMAQIPCFN